MKTTNPKQEEMKQQEFIDVLQNYMGTDPTEKNAETLAEDLYNIASDKLSWEALKSLSEEFLELDGKKRYAPTYVDGEKRIVVPRPEDAHVGPKERTLIYPTDRVNIWLVGYRDGDNTFYTPTSMHSKDNESLVGLDLDENGKLSYGQCFGCPPDFDRPEARRVFEPEIFEEDMVESWMVGFLTKEDAEARLEELKEIYGDDPDIDEIPELEILPAKIGGGEDPYFKIVESWGGETNEIAFYQLWPA